MQTPKHLADLPSPTHEPFVVRTFRKLPVEIQAVRLLRDNLAEVAAWCGGIPEPDYWLRIETLEGQLTAKAGDWIIKGVKGEFYPCQADIFAATYEEVGVHLTSRQAIGDPNA